MQDQEEYIFRAKTKEAHVIKIFGELLQNTIRFAPFRINEKGIFLTQSDVRVEQLIDISLYKENFSSYKCTKPQSFTVNTNHFYKMLRNIKKKNTITLFITEANPNFLCITTELADENNNKTTNTVRINHGRPDDFRLNEGYNNPVNMTSKEFQNLKTLHNKGRFVTVSSKPGFIRFFCDGQDMFTCDTCIGDPNESNEAPVIQTFTTNYITGLTKCAGASPNSNVQVYIHPVYPMKIKMRAGNLGDLTVYIKSREMIEVESTENGEDEEA